MLDVDVMQDASEIIHYDETDIPLYIRTGDLSSYPDMRALCHWHEDIEWIRILKGRMYYDVNGEKILLKENNCIMVNSRQMHYGYSCCHEECRFVCILFHPSLLTGCRFLQKNYVHSVTENQNIEYLYFGNGPEEAGQEEGQGMLRLLDQIVSIKDSGAPASGMEIIGTLHLLWSLIYKYSMAAFPQKAMPGNSDPSDISLQKTMVSYIYQHYTEKLALEDIAAAANICRSKCCSIFRRYLQQSPIDFLNAYRLEVSRNLLISTDSSITQIALSCGFNHLSYFSKLFLRHYGYSPSEYRCLPPSFHRPTVL